MGSMRGLAVPSGKYAVEPEVIGKQIKTLVIDGKNMTVRNFFAYPESLSVGETGTNLIHGAFLELFKHVKMFQPEQTVVTWDSRIKSVWRRKIYEGYKAGARGSMTEAQLKSFGIQNKIFQEGLDSLAVLQMAKDGVEGDDLTALAVIIPENRPSVIISTDNDFWQLVRGDLVRIYDPRKKSLLAGASFHLATGFDSPEHHLAYKVLKGDKGDGVPPAVIRMGKKKAVEMAKTFGLPSVTEVPTEFYAKQEKDLEFAMRCARNFKLVSLHAAVMGQLRELIHYRGAKSPKRDWGRFIDFCKRYQLKSVATAYTEVDRYI
jgi:5'-3' exonuclease